MNTQNRGRFGMLTRLNQLFADLTSSFSRHNFGMTISLFDFPLGLTFEGSPITLNRPSDLEEYLTDVYRARKNAGVHWTEPEVVAVEIPRGDKFRVWVKYHHLDSKGDPVSVSDRLFHIRDRRGKLLITAFQVENLPFDEMKGWTYQNKFIA